MSKKSYKRNQNRLYREIKRRIIAEQAALIPVPVIEIHGNIETLAIKNLIHSRFLNEIEIVKSEMANKIARKLVAEGYVEFFSSENKYEPIADVTEIEARIRVVKPTQKDELMPQCAELVRDPIELLKEQEGTINELQNAYGYLQKQYFEAQDKLLKEQEAVKPVRDEQTGRLWLCGNCGSYVGFEDSDPHDPNEFDKFCRECGRPVLWEGR